MSRRAHAARIAPELFTRRDPAAVRRRIKCFDAHLTRRLEGLSASHAHFEDLLWSFPAIAVAMAAADDNDAAVAAAGRLVVVGAPLRVIANALSLPMWLRRLPPEAFPRVVPPVPNGATFNAHIGNVMPDKDGDARRWLAFVSRAYVMGDAMYALWVARKWQHFAREEDFAALHALALYTWVSVRPELEAHRYLITPWVPKKSVAGTARNAAQWLECLEFPIYKSPHMAFEQAPTMVDGFAFAPIATPFDAIVAARDLDNCLAGYAVTLACGRTQVWTISWHGEIVAAIEIGFTREGRGMPEIEQLCAAANRSVASEILHAVYRWLLTFPERQVMDERFRAAEPDAAIYRRLIKPYWMAKGMVPWLPFDPRHDPLNQLARSLSRLGR